MADVHSSILLKTDPFLLDATVDNLENIAPNSSHSSPVLLGATSGGNSDEDRPFLHTSFNQLDGKKNKYRNPWKASESKAETEIVELEQTANEVWDAYRESYYGRDAVGSVFVRRKGSDTSKAKKGGRPRGPLWNPKEMLLGRKRKPGDCQVGQHPHRHHRGTQLRGWNMRIQNQDDRLVPVQARRRRRRSESGKTQEGSSNPKTQEEGAAEEKLFHQARRDTARKIWQGHR